MFRTCGIAAISLVAIGLEGCSRSAGSASCGIDALTRPLAVKQSFAEGHALTQVPDSFPTALPIRLVAGPAWRGTITADTGGRWRIQTHGSVSRSAHVGYGVLVIDERDVPRGVLAFDGHAVRGASDLGTLVIGDTMVPLLGVRIALSAIENAKCPVFPDSLR